MIIVSSLPARRIFLSVQLAHPEKDCFGAWCACSPAGSVLSFYHTIEVHLRAAGIHFLNKHNIDTASVLNLYTVGATQSADVPLKSQGPPPAASTARAVLRDA